MIIKNKEEFNKIDIKLGLIEIPSNEIKILYENDSWDGALEGICVWDKREYYFLCFDQLNEAGEDRWPRKYILLDLSEDQKAEEAKEHLQFASCEDKSTFFEAQKHFPQYEIEENQVVGWFQSLNPNSLK